MSQPFKIIPPIRLRDFDPAFDGGLDKDKTRRKTLKLCEQTGELQNLLYANRTHALLLIFQGMDTSGKDCAGARALQFVPPAGVETANFKAPSPAELSHDFLWRIHKAAPRYGNIGVFNRSHYEDVLAVRALKLQPREIWLRRYEQINAFEKILAANNTVILKFFLHISKGEQARRLQARLNDPTNTWKLEMNDFKLRRYWGDYQRAIEDCLNRCSTPYAPWHIVPADHRWYRDFVIAQSVVKALEKLKLMWPKTRMDVSRICIK